MLQLDCGSTIEPMNAGLFVSPGYGTHDTRVIDSYELIFVTSGRLGLFEDDDQYIVEKDQTLVLCPGLRHGGLFPYPQDLNFYWVHFRARPIPAPSTSVRVRKVTTVRDPEYMTELFCQFISDQEAAASGSLGPDSTVSLGFAELVTLMLCELGTESNRHADPTKRSEATRRQRLIAEKVEGYIDANYAAPISTAEVARSLEYSADYIERAYRRVKHMSILDALHEKRVREARSLLRGARSRNISEVAFACGFRDPSYFRRIFKRATGLTPRQFRSLYNRTHVNAH